MRKSQHGFSLIELLIVVVIIGIIAAIAIPNLLAARRAANETAAISNIRNIVSGQHACVATNAAATPKDFCTDTELHDAEILDVTFSTMNGSTERSGYKYNLTLLNSNKAYTILANPSSTSTGTRYFGSTEQGAIFENKTGAVSFDATTRAVNSGSIPIK